MGRGACRGSHCALVSLDRGPFSEKVSSFHLGHRVGRAENTKLPLPLQAPVTLSMLDWIHNFELRHECILLFLAIFCKP